MLTVIISVGILVFLIAATLILLLSPRSRVEARLAEVTAVSSPARHEEVVRTRFKLFSSASHLLIPVREMLGMSAESGVTRKLALAGYRQPEHAEIFYAARLLTPILCLVAGLLIIRQDRIFWSVALGAVGFFAPEFWLTGAISRRREAIRLALPDALDLLVICMEAGLGLDQALIRVGEEMKLGHRELSEEFLLVNLEQRAGKPRIEAWRHLADRTGLEVVRSFVSMLTQTERFGTPISKSLGHFADALRTKRRQQAEELAAKTTIKMIFPLVLFIFPSLFIVLLAPAVISISRNLGAAFK